MNNINIKASLLSESLQQIVGVVERKQTMPILSHILLDCSENDLTLTGTDLEVQLSCTIQGVNSDGDFITTIPGRKAFEIIRSLGEQDVEIAVSESSIKITSSNSSFKLKTLSSNEFPLFDATGTDTTFTIKQGELKTLFNKTQFAMAQQDVRFYLNGLLLEISPNTLVSVGTDGHRLAKSKVSIEKSKISDSSYILPRKAVQEIQRIIGNSGESKITFSDNRAVFEIGATTLVTKLIDGSFPDYTRVIPENTSINILLDVGKIKPALQRVSILANEKFKGVRVDLDDGVLNVSSENPEQEQATEAITIEKTGASLSVGFNVSYLIEAISACQGEMVSLGLNDENSSALITDPSDPESKYVVMPMRL
jgi:DNA polymerase-3 subunit beta